MAVVGPLGYNGDPMLDFRRKSSRSGKGREEQRRLLLPLLMLGIVIILVSKIGDPILWRWLDRQLVAPTGDDDKPAIDNRLDAVEPDKSLPPDTFEVVREHPAAKSADVRGYFPGVKATNFEAVRDDSPSRRGEQACSLHLLDILNRTKPQTLRRASMGPISYAQLFRQPSQYRGRLVTVSGTVRRASRIELSDNDYGLKEYYQIWLWPVDNPTAPMVIYCLRLPKGFPLGMEIAEQVELTGFFFKRLAYRAKDTIRLAPELLAGSLQWDQRPVMTPTEPAETWPIPVVVCVALALALSAAAYVYYRTRPGQRLLPDRPPNFDVLRTANPQKGDADDAT
jgi:hypothetical protein